MSRLGHIVWPFGDGRYEFFLGIAQLDELDEKLGVGPVTLFNRLAAGEPRAQDIRQIVRCALHGAGMKATEALAKVERYVDPPNGLLDHLPLAKAIMIEALIAPQSKKKSPRRAKRKGGDDERFQAGEIYGAGAAMGFSPQETGALSMYQFNAAVDGYIEANTPEDKRGGAGPPSRDEFRAIMDAPVRHGRAN